MLDKSGSPSGRSAGKEVAPKDGAPTNGSQASADRASLTYLTDAEPGIRRLRAGKGFSY
ncbi:MAG: DNA topoisomerase IB, partial [Mesorhizobium sp.]